MSDSISVNSGALDETLRTARALVERGQSLQAEQVYVQVLAAAPDNLEALTSLGLLALEQHQYGRAVHFLDGAVVSDPANPQLLKNLGLAYLGLQRLDEARFTLDRALQISPDFFVARLHLALAEEGIGREQAALRDYFLAILQAQAQDRWLNDATTAPPLRELVKHAMAFVDRGRKRLFTGVLGPLRAEHGDLALQRVMHALDIYLELAPANIPDPRQKPKFLYFPGLPTSAYFERELFPWYAELERNTDVIREELLGVLRDEQGLEPFIKFKSAEEIPQFLAGADGKPAWDAFFFYRHGVRYDDNCARCPRTAAIIDALPLVHIREHAPEICFSVLTPGTHILPHHGVTNTRLVTHLPLIVPERCAIRVGGEEHAWQEGRCITFDDTFEHEAWNRGDSTRVVLIADCWNPYLSQVECEAVTELVTAIGDFNRECGISAA
ncbi:MAG: aspartyl/asparaginyl beta-hydroxylase domain-containing protein [Rudaea sp.]|nr:aspartyl/asparaginyl beta-hydroxylase domain-containing protein [Rudaea sp.]